MLKPSLFRVFRTGSAARYLSLSAIQSDAVNLSSESSPRPKPWVRAPVTLIPGDGVGPEIADAIRDVFKAGGVPVDFETFFLSEINQASSASLQSVCESVVKNQVCLMGHLATPEFSRTGSLDSLGMKFRRELDLFANVVRIKNRQGIPTRHNNVDLVIIREQIEGEYSALEHESIPGVIECLKIVTEKRSRRIAKFAFDYAVRHGRKRVTAIHKANIMKLGDGLFLKSCQEVARLYPNIEFETMIVDNCTMQLVSNPHQFDVMVMPNLYGDILTNLASGLVGGAGVVAGESFSSDIACFEPATRHMFSLAAGKNLANPTGMLYASANLLSHLNLPFHSQMIKSAVDRVLRSGKHKTKDIGGHTTTKEFVNAIIKHLEP